MESKVNQGGPRGRQGGQRSGGGGRNRNRNRNQNRNRNRNRRNDGGPRSSNQSNRNRNRNRNRGRGGRKQAPEPTLIEKILSVITFGMLGKPAKKKSNKGRRKPASQKQNQPKSSQPKSAKKASRKERVEVTSPRLYVGNLDYGASEVELEELFRGIGTVQSAEVVTNSRTQQSKGFAFVEMGTLEEAMRAVDVLDDQDFMGRRLIISGAKSSGPRDESDDDNDQDNSSSEEGVSVGEQSYSS